MADETSDCAVLFFSFIIFDNDTNKVSFRRNEIASAVFLG